MKTVFNTLLLTAALVMLSACTKAPQAESMKLDRSRAILKEGTELTLVAEILPEASSKTLDWTSSDPKVATVDAHGRVKALTKGETTITATTRDGSALQATCSVRVYIAGNPVALDFGLSVLWADRDLGATCPEDAGDFYAWGELEPKDTYIWDNYRFGNSAETMTKYTEVPSVLAPEDDIAHVLLGGKWRMPTEAEVDELIFGSDRYFKNEDATINGVKGYRIRGISGDLEGKYIFFPFNGYAADGKVKNVGKGYYYWVAKKSCAPEKAVMLMLYPIDDGNRGISFRPRYHGANIRPVCDK